MEHSWFCNAVHIYGVERSLIVPGPIDIVPTKKAIE